MGRRVYVKKVVDHGEVTLLYFDSNGDEIDSEAASVFLTSAIDSSSDYGRHRGIFSPKTTVGMHYGKHYRTFKFRPLSMSMTKEQFGSEVHKRVEEVREWVLRCKLNDEAASWKICLDS